MRGRCSQMHAHSAVAYYNTQSIPRNYSLVTNDTILPVNKTILTKIPISIQDKLLENTVLILITPFHHNSSGQMKSLKSNDRLTSFHSLSS